MAEPAAFHVEALEHRCVEQLAGPVVGLAIGVTAADNQRRGQFKDLLPFGKVGIKIDQPVFGGSDCRADPGLLVLQGGDVDGPAVVGADQLASSADLP